MKHARSDYDRIQDPAGIIPVDEPVFLIRGQDALAPDMLRLYGQEARKRGAARHLVEAVFAHAKRMEDWQNNTHSKKIADMPQDTVA